MSETGLHPSETTASSPGAILKRCREYHQIPLEEAAEATKIGISHLSALEGDQIREFANRTYLKGFLRIYATYLGLNSDDLSRMYDKLYGVSPELSDNSRTASRPTRPDQRLKLLKRLVFPGILLVLVLLAATFFKHSPSQPVRPPRPTPAAVQSPAAVQPSRSSARSQIPLPPSKPAVPETKPPVKTEPVAERPDARQPEAGKAFVFRVKVTQNGSMAASIDGLGVQNYDLTVGDVIEWKAERAVALELSNAGGVEVEVNGKPFRQIGPIGQSVYVEFDADGIRP